MRAKAEIERLKGELQRFTASPAPIPKIHQETLPIAAPLEKSEVLNASQNENESLENAKINPLLDLNGLGILKLKKLASGRVKRYSNMTKPELVEQLTPFNLTDQDLAIALAEKS